MRDCELKHVTVQTTGEQDGKDGLLRSLPVNNGHSKTASDPVTHAMNMSLWIERATVRFPQLHFYDVSSHRGHREPSGC